MIFRGFGKRRHSPEIEARIPPGQTLTEKWPILMSRTPYSSPPYGKDKDGKDVKGVTAEVDTKSLISSGDAVATVTVAADAAVGEYTLTFEIAAEGGMPATGTAKVSVKVVK